MLDQHLALYNASEQKLVGIFRNISIAARFIFPTTKSPDCSKRSVDRALRAKTRIHPKSSQQPFIIALRYASLKQIEQLGDQPYIILDPTYEQVAKRLLCRQG